MQKKKPSTIIKVPELKVAYHKERAIDFPHKIKGSETAAKLIRSLYDDGEIELREVVFIIYFNRAKEPIGYYKHSTGGIAGTVIDIRLILGTALKSLSSAIIISHNHPSGNSKPSERDIKLTVKLQEAARLHDIDILDHIVITKNKHYSLADNGLMGLRTFYPIEKIQSDQLEENIELLEIEAKAIALELSLLKF